jgi:neutral amino acid transport system permease protein
MEAADLTATANRSAADQLRDFARRRPALAAVGVLVVIVLVLVASKGLHETAQTALNGLSLGSVYALGAVGLTLVYGILKLVNFAHGDFLTFGAYMAYLVNVTWGMPLVVGVFFAMATTALLGLFFERVMWRPMRAKGAGLLQLLLMSIGLAFVIRAVIQWFWSTDLRILDVNVTSTVEFLGLRLGRTQLIVIIVGFAVLIAVGLMLR